MQQFVEPPDSFAEINKQRGGIQRECWSEGRGNTPDPLPRPLYEHALSMSPSRKIKKIKCQWNGWCVQLRWDLLPPLAVIHELFLQELELTSMCMLEFWRSLAFMGIAGKHFPSLRWREPCLFYSCSFLSCVMLRRAVVEICTSERSCTVSPTLQFLSSFEHLACNPALSSIWRWTARLDKAGFLKLPVYVLD